MSTTSRMNASINVTASFQPDATTPLNYCKGSNTTYTARFSQTKFFSTTRSEVSRFYNDSRPISSVIFNGGTEFTCLLPLSVQQKPIPGSKKNDPIEYNILLTVPGRNILKTISLNPTYTDRSTFHIRFFLDEKEGILDPNERFKLSYTIVRNSEKNGESESAFSSSPPSTNRVKLKISVGDSNFDNKATLSTPSQGHRKQLSRSERIQNFLDVYPEGAASAASPSLDHRRQLSRSKAIKQPLDRIPSEESIQDEATGVDNSNDLHFSPNGETKHSW